MAHRERFMQEVTPGRWIIQCRICPKRSHPGYSGGKAVFSTAKECHDWWTEHEGSEKHASNRTPEGRDKRRHDTALNRMNFDELIQHLRDCAICAPKTRRQA